MTPVALTTGATGAIGQAIARRMAWDEACQLSAPQYFQLFDKSCHLFVIVSL